MSKLTDKELNAAQAALAEAQAVAATMKAALVEANGYLRDEEKAGVVRAGMIRLRVSDALTAYDGCAELRPPTQIADEPWSPERWTEENPPRQIGRGMPER